jgi:hypothetical protein
VGALQPARLTATTATMPRQVRLKCHPPVHRQNPPAACIEDAAPITRFTSASVHLACRVIFVNKYSLPGPSLVGRHAPRRLLKRLVGYDNERGKGGHRHIEDRQERYVFKTVELLIADFLADVCGLRGER